MEKPEVIIEDVFHDDQFAEDFVLVQDSLAKMLNRFGRSTLTPTEQDGASIDRYLKKEMAKFGRMHNGFIPKKVQEGVLDRDYCISVEGVRERYWLFFHPTLSKDKKDKRSAIKMDLQRIQSLSTPRGRYIMALLQPHRIFLFKSHCVVRLMQRTDPPMSEQDAMTCLMSIAYDLTTPLAAGDQDFDASCGGKIKAKVGLAKAKTRTGSDSEWEPAMTHIVICYTYYPPHFVD